MSPRHPDAAATPAETDVLLPSHAPALSALCVLASWAGTFTRHMVLPAQLGSAQRQALLATERIGAFMVNLASICGMVALAMGLFTLIRDARFVGMQRRLLMAMFSGILLPSLVVATFLERERTTTELVLFTLGAAQVLAVMLCTSAARLAHERSARLLALTMAVAAACALGAQLLELLARQSLAVWQEQGRQLAARVGEAAYLLGLLISPFFVTTAPKTLRDHVARGLGIGVMGAVAAAFYLSGSALSRDYAVTLYHAQRVSLFVDSVPALYALPMGAALAAGSSAAFGSDPSRRQAGLGLLLWLGSGFAPRTPDALLTATLGCLLLLRAMAAQRTLRSPAEPPPGVAAPATEVAAIDD